ncbi:hypothetical protein RV15_GL002506 [Enterococcus silesiacus]|uniref:Uncharacterized protein n=1 Tax=Enterococcus silesiacus TaxID=332949 RepID=A0AA91JMP8_9ENTE|nr:hypothetical protein RV15_GL002506 [Enterococcus silesiacus]
MDSKHKLENTLFLSNFSELKEIKCFFSYLEDIKDQTLILEVY